MFAGHNKGKYYLPGEGYVRGKKSDKQSETHLGIYHACPFCGYSNTLEIEHKICSGCKRVWFRKQNGDFIYVDYIRDGK